MEIPFPELPVEFEQKTGAKRSFNNCTEVNVKSENITQYSKVKGDLSNLHTRIVKPEPESLSGSSDREEGSEVPFTDIDISHPDVKRECLEYSRNADQHIGSRRSSQDAVLKDSSKPPTMSETCAANENTSGHKLIPINRAVYSKKQWSKDECSNLIELYLQHAHLWDATSMDYKNRNKRQDSLKEIADIFETSSDEIERKIKNLISQYKRERRKYKSMKKSGTGHSFVSKWFGYDAMSFLHDKNKPRKGGRQGGLNLETEDSDSSSNSSSNDTQSTTCEENLDEASSGNAPEIHSRPPEEPTSSRDGQADAGKRDHSFTVPNTTSKKLKSGPTNVRREAFNMLRAMVDSRKTQEDSIRDDYEVFGDLVGRKVRSLKTNYAKVTVQHVINNILYDAELGKYDEPAPAHCAGPATSSAASPSPLSFHSNRETSTSGRMDNNLNRSNS